MYLGISASIFFIDWDFLPDNNQHGPCLRCRRSCLRLCPCIRFCPNSSVQVDSSRACPPGLASPEPSGTIHDLGQHFHWWPVVVCWCRAVAPCCLFSFAGGVGLCLFPVCAVLWCAARRVVRFRLSLRCCRCFVLWRVPVCCGVSLGVLRCGGAGLVFRGVLLCCALSCGVLRPVLCPAVLCCLAVLCWWALLCGSLRCWCLYFLLSSFPLLKTPPVFPCL